MRKVVNFLGHVRIVHSLILIPKLEYFNLFIEHLAMWLNKKFCKRSNSKFVVPEVLIFVVGVDVSN